jgi:hypothetical protein
MNYSATSGPVKTGRIRMKIRKEHAETGYPNFHVLNFKILKDTPLRGLPGVGRLGEELRNGGADWMLRESVGDMIETYTDGAVLEIEGDVFIEDSKYWTDCGYEYDSTVWLQDAKVRPLRKRK